MEYRTKSFIKNVTKESKIMILVDNDADGFSSAAMLFSYLSKQSYSNIVFEFSEGKSHGLKNVIDDIVSKKPNFLFIPDSSTNDIKEQQVLADSGIDYLILDHHDISSEILIKEKFLPIINNQSIENKDVNKEFTGVGMVYMFCKALDHNLDTNIADTLLHLFAVGQIGDVSDVSNLEIRYLMLKGFQQIKDHNLFSKSVEDDVSAHALSFSIIPLLNSVSRVGSIEDKSNLLNAMVLKTNENKQYEIRKRMKSPVDNKFHVIPVKTDFYTYETRELQRIKRKQKKSVEKSVSSLKNIHELEKFVVAVDEDNQVDPGQTGLIATQFAQKYQKPALVLLKHNEDTLTGSARGFEAIMPNFKDYLLQTSLFELCAGHANAFGVRIIHTNLVKLLNIQNEENSSNTTYGVDSIYTDRTPSSDEIIDFNVNRSLFGGAVGEPLIGFKGLNVNRFTIKIRGSVITFFINRISFILFKANEYLLNLFNPNSHSTLCFDIYGKPDINNFRNISTPQIIIEDIVEVSKTNEENTNFDSFVF